MGNKKLDGDRLFAAWVRGMGFNEKQITEAGKLLGYGIYQAGRRYRGEVAPMSKIERLGLTAAFLGLPEFTEALADADGKQLAKAYAGARMIKECLRGVVQADHEVCESNTPATQEVSSDG